ncbi:MFS transporter [Demequina sp. NBRC 110057]|uniref:MFS transporter n=1 Tax=Demequina sp. NBRC 110057 TaxID=1570346 RepID=UPI0013563FBD|nr:MFS transporter [Demequina sp. NBRC 110057]
MTDLPALSAAGQPRWRLPRTATSPRARYVLAAFALIGFSIGISQNAAPAVMQDQLRDLGTTVDVLGLAQVSYCLGVVVGAPLILVGLGRVGRRPLLVVLSLAFALLSVATVAAPSIGALIGIRFIAGLPHGALLGVASFVAMTVLGRERRGTGVAIIMLGLTCSQIIGVPFSQWLSEAVSWRASYAVVAAVGLLAFAAVWAFTPDVPGNPHASPRQEMTAMRSVPLWTAIVTITVGFSGLGAVLAYIVPLLEIDNGLDPSAVTWVLVLWGVGTSVGAFVGGRLTDRDHLSAGRLGLWLTAAALLGIGAVGSSPVATIPLLFLLAIATQIYAQSGQVHLMDVLHGSPSLGSALSHAALNAASALGTGIGALIIAAGLGYQAPAWAALVLTGVALVLMAVGPGFRRSRTVAAL